MPSDSDGQIINHKDKKLIEASKKRLDTMPTDGLPCSVLEVPRYLYVNSDLQKRRTSEILRKYMREQIFRGEYDDFMNSREGRHYFLGLLPSGRNSGKRKVFKSPRHNSTFQNG